MILRVEHQLTIRQFLLGQLRDESRTEVECALLISDGVYEELLIQEDELVDAFISLGLTPDERRRMEETFFITEWELKKLRFSAALARYLANS